MVRVPISRVQNNTEDINCEIKHMELCGNKKIAYNNYTFF